MSILDPKALFRRIAEDVPAELHTHLYLVGSLAAAYHYAGKLTGRAVNTKDADVVIHPAGDEVSCASAAAELLRMGWRPKTGVCFPQARPDPPENLRVVRLNPPESDNYFVEFLQLPSATQTEPTDWKPLQLADGWYVVPSFRFFAVTAFERLASEPGLEYAQPAMLALANLLAHPQLGDKRIEETRQLRSAKDLGRVLALTWLEGRDGAEAWQGTWRRALEQCYPVEWKALAHDLGAGLEQLLGNNEAMEQAHQTTDIGLLGGLNVTVAQLRAVGHRLLQDVVEPLKKSV